MWPPRAGCDPAAFMPLWEMRHLMQEAAEAAMRNMLQAPDASRAVRWG